MITIFQQWNFHLVQVKTKYERLLLQVLFQQSLDKQDCNFWYYITTHCHMVGHCRIHRTLVPYLHHIQHQEGQHRCQDTWHDALVVHHHRMQNTNKQEIETYFNFLIIIHGAICNLTHRKVPVVGRLDFEFRGYKVKISQNVVPKSILRFHIFWLWTLHYLIFKLLEGFGAKQCVHIKNGHLNCQNTNTLYRFPNFKTLFLKINFSPICYDILNEIAISQERNVQFQTFLHPNGAKRTAI